MLGDEHERSRACVSCLGVLKELAKASLRFRGFKNKKTLWRMYSKVENNKYPTNKVLSYLRYLTSKNNLCTFLLHVILKRQ